MLQGGEPKPHIERRHSDRVSSAFWPVHIRRGVSTSRVAQCRRHWMMQGRWWFVLINALARRVLQAWRTLRRATRKRNGAAGRFSQDARTAKGQPRLLTGSAPTTPLSVEAPLIRVLETYDVRTTPIKHLRTHMPENPTEQALLRALPPDLWGHTLNPRWSGQRFPCTQDDPVSAPDLSYPGEHPENQGSGNAFSESGI